MDILNKINNTEYFINKNILITGGTGTLGNILVEYFLNKLDCNKICIFSRDEFKQYNMKIKFKNNKNFNKLRFFIGDIRELDRITHATKNIDIVFHAAALKQVDSIEYNPMEAIKTNILGTQNVVEACIKNDVKQLVGISTDKSVSPANLYGATKLCLEKIVTSGHEYSGDKLKTCVLRYGNVIGSRGSVVPVFLNQKDKGEFTITDKSMTRFTITIKQACIFILNCVTLSHGGEIFVPKLPKYTLPQLCRVINPDNKIKEIGIRPGEKLHEKMINSTESLKVWESKNFYVIETTYKLKDEIIKNCDLIKNTKLFSYSSKNGDLISDEELLKQIETYKE